MLLCCTLLHNTLHPYCLSEEGTRPGRTLKKPKDLSTCESEECVCGEDVCVYVSVMESGTLYSCLDVVKMKLLQILSTVEKFNVAKFPVVK